MTDAVKIRTNHQWRNLLYGYELAEKEKAEFDWIDEEEIDFHSFLRYKGYVYSLDQFMRVNNNALLRGWDGYFSDSAFSGVLIKLSDGEQYQIATYIS